MQEDVEELLAARNKQLHHAAVATSSRQWSAQTESRIVRVSRVFGGKDRHSKVKTVKGLRDRRVRLSVPTAIQLYDLQDRLGLNQPSKVVDWLLNAARHEIDKLPPLQFPPQQDHLMVAVGGHHHLALAPHHHMLPLPVHEEKFVAQMATDGGGASKVVGHHHQADVDVVDGAGAHHHLGRSSFPGGGGGGYHRFMELNSALGMVSRSAMAPPPYSNSYTGEAWNNSSGGSGGVHHVHDGGGGAGGSPQVVAAAAGAHHHHSPFPSLLSLAPRPHHQLVFYSSEAADQQFQLVENGLGSQSLSLSSARAYYHDDDQAS